MNMYRRVAFSLLLFVLSALSCFADEPTAPRSAANIAYRDSVVSFLKSEGFVPSVDDGGNIWFKKEGYDFLATIYDDAAPFFVRIGYCLSSDGIDDQVALLSAVNYVNLNCRCVKCSIGEKGYLLIAVESYYNTAQVFKDNFLTYTDHIIQVGRLLAEFIDQYSLQK